MQNINLEKKLREIFKERFSENFPLSEYTSFKCGGKAKYIVFPVNIDEVLKIFEILKDYKEKFLILGKGTNVLISDNGFDGVVISTLRMRKYEIENGIIKCECGLKISDILKICIENSLTGIEFLAGIPGSVGGAVKNNAGLKREWISEKINVVEYVDISKLKVMKKRREEIFFDYRKSEFNNNFFIWRVEFFLQKGKKDIIKKMIKEYLEERKKRQPFGYSAGSIFKNPYPYFAGELIEKCGLKGFSIGDCYISEKHANFIINRGKGKAEDVYRLIKIIKEKVKEKFGIELETEIEIIGEFE